MAAKRIEWAQKLRGENCRKLATDLDGNGAEGRPLPSDGTSFVPNCRKRGNEFLTSSSGLIGVGRLAGRSGRQRGWTLPPGKQRRRSARLLIVRWAGSPRQAHDQESCAPVAVSRCTRLKDGLWI